MLSSADRAKLHQELAVMLRDWRGLLTRHVAQARQILRKLPKTRIVFHPHDRDGVAGYRFEAQGTLQPLLTGLVQNVASPAGFDDACSCAITGWFASHAA
jgi:hypothetical protein